MEDYRMPGGMENSNRAAVFAVSIVHDLRNPLAAICASAEMYEAKVDPAQARRLTCNIHRAAGRMRDLLTDLACTTRGGGEATESCNLRAILSSACEAAGATERKDVEIQVDVTAALALPMTRTRMKRVFLNPVVNSIEAMPGGGTIRITATQGGARVLIAVEDSGPGIRTEVRGRLFEPFVTAGKEDGLGLGLTLSRQTLRDHGGELWIEPAAGARFVISLPLRSPARAFWAEGAPAASATGETQNECCI
jgi:signal transduction histidine kinase